MHDPQLTVHPPLYLIGKMYSCWRCAAKMPVVTLLAPTVDDMDAQPCVLSDVTRLPDDVLAYIQKRVPTYVMCYSKTIQGKYFASTCPKCKVISGDFHLHSEPDAPFFPTDEEQAATLYMTEIPIDGTIHVHASPNPGCADMIMEHAQRIA
jgi:hypothetical protein